MTDQPTPEAVEAVARIIRDHTDTAARSYDAAEDLLPFIRDAIHRDGDDANAIRESLGLRWSLPLTPNLRKPEDRVRRLLGKWQEDQP